MPETVSIDYTPPPTLQKFMESMAWVRMVLGPYGSGKSSACVMELLTRAMEVPQSKDGLRHSRWVIIRNTYGELQDTTRKTFEQWIPSEICWWDETKFVAHIEFNDVRAEVLFRALDRPDHVKKLLSLELTGAYINEAREVPKIIFDNIQGRIGRYPKKSDVTTPENPAGTYWSGLWCDSNPPDTDHWIYRLFEEHPPSQSFTLEDGTVINGEFRIFKQPSALSSQAENRENLQPGYYERMMLGKDEDWINVNIRAQYGFVREGKPVFPEYDDARHCRPLTEMATGKLLLLCGQDFGLTPAAVIAQRDPKDQQLQVVRELVSDDMGAASFAKELKRLLNAEFPGRSVRGWGDPAGEQRAQTDERTPYDIIRAAGLPFDPAPTNDVRRRLEAVKGLLMRSTFLGRPAIVISPECRVLRKALMGGYCRARVKMSGEERFTDEPKKNRFSHVADALQYLCVGEGEDDRAIHGEAGQRKASQRFKVKKNLNW